ncbi:inactive phospholipase D5 isoform X1 [Corythoichthys intestinalis]|uniref:inactive phospholipase D5 isoform X1 n=1 Tax=Corythoichthys intestinalis TaxID=161448 RepID=UPI0025A600A0|nr:inactive phospholipase D5 isoform X1 [Corythoichthys intestinalis]
MELSNYPRSRGHEEAPPALLPDLSQVKNSSFSASQQQGYSATIFLRRKDKLEKTQQKCIAIFALLCCFAVLLVLIFSSVDIWGDSEDGITEENCRTDCRIVLVETIPEELKEHLNGGPHLSLLAGFHTLLDQAKHSVQIVSPVWNLRPSETMQSRERLGQPLFQRLLSLKSRGVKLKIASSLTNSTEQKILAEHNAEVHLVNMTAFTRGQLHSSFWIIDRTHFYIGSADMDWRSFSKRKELGLMVYNCSCLALDLHRIFSFYWQLHDRDYIPSIWSKRVTALYGNHQALELELNNTPAVAYVSTSPDLFCAKERTRDVDAIYHVMQSANAFIFISVTDYLPLVTRGLRGISVTRYWSPLDEMIREAVVLRGIKVRLLISFWKNTHPLTFNFVTSLKSLCVQLYNCSLEVKFFSQKEKKDDAQHGLNHNKYMLTDNAFYIGNHNWVGNEFSDNGGVGLVVQMKNGGGKVLEQIKTAFDRDWTSPYSKSLLGNKDQDNKYRHLHQVNTKEENEWKNGLVV